MAYAQIAFRHVLRPWLCAIAALLVLTGGMATPTLAVQPDEVLEDAALEKRARALSAELRCLVCQNQSIDDSDAPLARDLRLLVRERLKEGDTNDQVMSFIVDRYGEFVLLKPPFGTHTLFLWLAPLGVLLIAIWTVRTTVLSGARREAAIKVGAVTGGEPGLSPEEQQRLKALLEEKNRS